MVVAGVRALWANLQARQVMFFQQTAPLDFYLGDPTRFPHHTVQCATKFPAFRSAIFCVLSLQFHWVVSSSFVMGEG